MEFSTEVELGGKTATGFEVPAGVVQSLGSHKRPPVRVTINGYSYRSTVAVMGGRFMLPLSAENRTGAGVAAGDRVTVNIELDHEPREIVVPPDLLVALNADAVAGKRFAELSYSRRKEHALSVEGAKTPETRKRRIEKCLSLLRQA